MKNYILSNANKLILAILALFGFSCDINDSPKVEYGSPTANFKIHGSISDKTTTAKLSGMQVAVNGDTVLTNADGNYEVVLLAAPSSQTFYATFKDINGSLGGEYQQKDSSITFTDPDFSNGDGKWYLGEVSKEINIELEPKK